MKSKNNIPAIIGKLLPWERKHIVNTITISENIISFLHETKMPREQFSRIFNVDLKECNKFIHGEWEYSLSDRSRLEHLWTLYRRAQLHIDIVKVMNQEKLQNQKENEIKDQNYQTNT